MSGTLHLTITTPVAVLVDDGEVASLRAEDASGGFGILPGHVDLLTVLPASVVRWRGPEGRPRYCVLRAGVMTVRGGRRIEIACREGILGDDVARLEDDVARLRETEADADRKARVAEMRLQARAVRQVMRFLRPGRGGAFDHPPAIPRAAGEGPP